jgi:hypothetical protein
MLKFVFVIIGMMVFGLVSTQFFSEKMSSRQPVREINAKIIENEQESPISRVPASLIPNAKK